MRAVRFTLMQAALSALLSTLLAIPLARALATRDFPGKGGGIVVVWRAVYPAGYRGHPWPARHLGQERPHPCARHGHRYCQFLDLWLARHFAGPYLFQSSTCNAYFTARLAGDPLRAMAARIPAWYEFQHHRPPYRMADAQGTSPRCARHYLPALRDEFYGRPLRWEVAPGQPLSSSLSIKPFATTLILNARLCLPACKSSFALGWRSSLASSRKITTQARALAVQSKGATAHQYQLV